MDRFGAYFLGNILQLDDHFCRYYTQPVHRIHEDILDVPHMWFFEEERAEQWLSQCVECAPDDTLRALRDFLWYHGTEGWQLHRMYDDAVLQAAAVELVLHSFKVVIRPGLGAVVQTDSDPFGCGYPFALTTAPDIDARFTRLARHLDPMVGRQKRRADDDPGEIATALAAYPGFHSGLLRQLPDLGAGPQRLFDMRRAACQQGHPSPVAQQIDTVAAALHPDRNSRRACRAMLTILLNDPEVMTLVHDFAPDHLAATGAKERRQLGIATTEQMAAALILSVAVLNSDHGSTVAAHNVNLAKAAELMRRLAGELKSIAPRYWPSVKSRRAEAARPGKQPTQQRTPPPDPFQQNNRAAVVPRLPDPHAPLMLQQSPPPPTATAQAPPQPHDLAMELYARREKGEEPLSLAEPGHRLDGPEQLRGDATPQRLDQNDISEGNYKFVSQGRKMENRQLKA